MALLAESLVVVVRGDCWTAVMVWTTMWWLRARRTCWLRSEMLGATSYRLFTIQLTRASHLTIAVRDNTIRTSMTCAQCFNRRSWQRYRHWMQRPIRIPYRLKISKLNTNKVLKCKQPSSTKTQFSPKKSAMGQSLKKLTFRLICTNRAMK